MSRQRKSIYDLPHFDMPLHSMRAEMRCRIVDGQQQAEWFGSPKASLLVTPSMWPLAENNVFYPLTAVGYCMDHDLLLCYRRDAGRAFIAGKRLALVLKRFNFHLLRTLYRTGRKLGICEARDVAARGSWSNIRWFPSIRRN